MRDEQNNIKKKTVIDGQDSIAWDDFVFWCKARGLAAVPANPWTLSAYALWLETQLPHKEIIRAFKTIYKIHATKTRRRPDRAPLLIKTLKKMRVRDDKKKQPKSKKISFFPEIDILEINQLKQKEFSPKVSVKKIRKKKTLPGLSTSPKLISKHKLSK